MRLLRGSILKLKVINTGNFIQLHSYTTTKHLKIKKIKRYLTLNDYYIFSN